ncbi:MAG: endonuclease/exonuclease/phosphatase family protein [Deltaproteobacteria bacterium]|jgi:endonuclease/exonuclease/phosphatase family metal-dependent hydrolase|nr:endonuclease/exonuclease/phosphatase family protein [Deltaproteobacteria bacterium]
MVSIRTVALLGGASLALLLSCGEDSGASGVGGSGASGAGSSFDAGVDAEPPDSATPEACVGSCGDRECGNDGCSESCGDCEPLESCTDDAWCLAPDTAADAPPVRVATYNTCGAKCDYTGIAPADWTAGIVADITDWDTDAVLFTELCYGQLTLVRGVLGSGWGYVWLASHADIAGCANWGTDRRFGMAIVAKHTEDVLPERQTDQLMPPGSCDDNNPRNILCAEPSIDGRVTLTCVTHLTHKPGDCRAEQARTVASLTLAWSGDGPTIVGGDLNARPEDAALDSLYRLGGTGRYLEADQEDPAWWPASCTGSCRSGEPTFPAANPDRRIDYVMFSADHFGSVTGGVLPSDGSQSDHLLTRGAARSR